MSITKDSSRQDIKIAVVGFDYAALSTGIETNLAVAAIDLPPGAVVVGGALIVDTAWVGPTVATLDVGDAVSGTRYKTDVDLKTAARTELVPTGYEHVNASNEIKVQYTSTVAGASAGAARLEVQYYVDGRTESVYEN